MIENKREIVWDYLRAFTLFLLFVDHVFHAYGLHFRRWHFFASTEAAPWVDMIYLHNNNVITPLLFFVVGLFVIPSLKEKGSKGFWVERLRKLGIPWLIGIPFIVPFLSYPRYLTVYPDITLYNFLFKIYFPDSMQGGGPFWILWYLLFLTGLAFVIYKAFPKLELLQRGLVAWSRHPMIGVGLVTSVVVLLLWTSDLYGGSYAWVGFVNFFEAPSLYTEPTWFYHVIKLFKVQGSRFLVQGLFFFLGVTVGSSPLLKDKLFWEKVAQSWKAWGLLYLVSFTAYAVYVYLNLEDHFDALFFNEFSNLRSQGYEGMLINQAFNNHLKLVSPRILLQGLTLVMTCMAYISFFHRFAKDYHPRACQWVKNSYGFFLIHELFVIWLQYGLESYKLPIIIKASIILCVGGGTTFFLVTLLRKNNYVRKIL